MEQITKQFNIYEFQELCETAKEKVKQWWLDDETRNEDFQAFTEEYLKAEFPNSELKVQYSLNSCQGDGLNIFGDLDFYDMLKKLSGYTEKEQRTLEFYFEHSTHVYTFEVNSRYCYSCKFIDKKYIDYVLEDIVSELTYQDIANINKDLIKKFLDNMLDYFEILDKEREKDGYNYLYNIDDEEMEDICSVNEYKFLEDGTFYC
mgnify:CR=1 FL=1